jgi:hypothetical protein
MFTMVTENTRRTVSAVAAVAVVAFTGLTLDQGHLGALPQGTVEVGELSAVNVMQMASVTLPGITVTAARSRPASQVAAAKPQQPALLPTLAAAALAAADDNQAGANSASTPSVLLK